MGNIAGVGFVLMGIGSLLCFANSGGLVEYLKLRNLERHGVEGEAVSPREEWLSSGPHVFYKILLPESSPRGYAPFFEEVGANPRGPVGTVVPVVYDRRKPTRAKTGVLSDIDSSEERFHVALFWAPGLALMAVGGLLALIFY
ncbi:DUF3592 domain-containing protein [Streptomyces sp. NPDC002838]|uniref:DUF3592 domain-containing protein n=1 Tax=Streptomyces sp. NPDC002838 TaxID=3154436 RepID=UPI0033167D33